MKELTLYAMYKIRNAEINDSCVSRPIIKNERIPDTGEMWYRHDNGKDSLKFEDIVPGMDIEFWWPYEDRGNPPRFRKCRVFGVRVVDPESDTAESLAHQDHKTIAKRELDLTDEQLESEDFEQILTDVVEELFEPKNTSPDTARLEELRRKRDSVRQEYYEKRARLDKLLISYAKIHNQL